MRRHRVLTSALVAAGLVLGPLAATPSAPSTAAEPRPATSTHAATGTAGTDEPALALPRPTGRWPVSTRARQVVDRTRTDPWRDGPRVLVTTLTYPTRDHSGSPSRYLSPAESVAYLAFQEENGAPVPEGLSRRILSRVDTGATVGGRPAHGRHPLVVLSPGFSLPRASLTALATDLASHGYVVVSVDHVGETSGTELADGTLVGCAACDVEDYARVPRVRARDLRLVLDRTARLRFVDPTSVAVAGHSIGGNTAATWMAHDRRVDAGVDLDGTFFEPVRRPLRRAFLMMGTESLHSPEGEDATWDATWRRLVNPQSRWLTVRGGGHGSFTDLPSLAEQAGQPAQGLTGDRAITITRAYVRAFLDRALRHRGDALLDRPSPVFPRSSAVVPDALRASSDR